MDLQTKKINNFFYIGYICYFLALFVAVTSSDLGELLKKIFAFCSAVCLAINFISFQKVKMKKSKIKFFMIIFLATILAIIYRDFFVLMLILFALNCKEINYKQLLKLSFILLLFFTLFVLSLYGLGLLQGVNNEYFSGNTRYTRYALGFNHSNVLPQVLVYLMVYYFIFKKKINWLFVSIMGILDIIVYLFCHSRNGLYAFWILLFGIIVCRISSDLVLINKLVYKLSVIMAPVTVIFWYVFLYLFNKNSILGVYLNKILSNRLYLASIFFHFQPIKFLQLMTYHEFEIRALVLDNGFFYATGRYGMVFLFLLACVICQCVFCFKKDENINALVCCIVLCIINSIDNGFFSCLFYPFYIIGFQRLLYSDSKLLKKKDEEIKRLYL